MQARYQYGDLSIRKRNKGPDLWQFRYYQDGRRRSVLIGTVEKLPTRADAERAIEHLRHTINAQNPQAQFHSVTVGALADRFMEEYAPKHCRLNTRNNYRGILDNHIRPRWGTELIQNVKPMVLADWLESYPHSRQVKSHIRSLMHTLFQAALLWDMVERNPVDPVRQSGKRLKPPRVLRPEEFKALTEQLAEPYRSMAVVIGCLGLRVSELVGMRWGDIDFGNLTVRIQRSFVRGEINPTKTEASEGALPLDPDLADVLLTHKGKSAYTTDLDFVFAGADGKPRWPESMLADHLKPAAVKAGIGNIGWHTFRHTYSTLLHAMGAAPAVQKELLRHANIQTTLNVYTQAVSEEKRVAASRVARALCGAQRVRMGTFRKRLTSRN
jgi:integrase